MLQKYKRYIFALSYIKCKIMWKYYALLSAVFASLTAIFAKIGIKGGSRKLMGDLFPKSIKITNFALWKEIKWKLLPVSCCLPKYWIILR